MSTVNSLFPTLPITQKVCRWVVPAKAWNDISGIASSADSISMSTSFSFLFGCTSTIINSCGLEQRCPGTYLFHASIHITVEVQSFFTPLPCLLSCESSDRPTKGTCCLRCPLRKGRTKNSHCGILLLSWMEWRCCWPKVIACFLLELVAFFY